MANGFGAVLIVLGLPGAVWPYKLSKLEEGIDAIGSKRRGSEVEPADRKVTVNRIVGIGTVAFGAPMLVAG
jgi:hypothetical protein